ncbi:MAG: ATP-binding protein, partial [Propionivibrio sp.]
MNAPLDLDWTTANQQLLVAEFARLRRLLGDDVENAGGGNPAQIEAMRECMPAPAAIDTLTQLFELSAFERDVLLLAAGVEMDARLAALCGDVSGQPQKPWATFGLALAALPDPHWSALAPVEALRRWRLIDIDETACAGLTTARLKLDERVLHFIGGLNYLDHRLRPLFAAVPPAGLMADAHRALAMDAAERLRARRGRLPAVLLVGDDDSGQRDVAATVAGVLGVTLFSLRASDIPAAVHEQASLAALWQREAALLGSGLLITNADDGADGALARFIGQLDGFVFAAGCRIAQLPNETLRFTVNKPDAPGQRALWHAALGERATSLADALDGLASQYRLGAARISRHAAQLNGADAPRSATQSAVFLHQLCRGDGSALSALAQPIDACATWDDLILPEAQRRTLEQIIVHTRHRLTVHHDWGFASKGVRGLGIATLFAGESGTGKTLAAEVLANALDLALDRIDLSSVVSKYIGETEKNLRKVFDAAEDIGAILLFDEADALL